MNTTLAGWTIEEAAEQLHPPMGAAEVRALITVFRIPVIGYRRTGGRGRPAPEYSQSIVLMAHAIVVGATPTLRTDAAG